MSLWLLSLLLTKHLVVDGPAQTPWMYRNKGIWGHPGGVTHAALHGLGTWIVLIPFVSFWLSLALAMIDGHVHYVIDWSKVNINARMGWRMDNSEFFWWLLLADQYLHSATYIMLVSVIWWLS